MNKIKPNKQNKSADKRSYKQLQQISSAALLEEASHSRLIFKGIIAVAIIIALLIAWSGYVTIEETATTYGEVIPKGQVQIVEHLEGGIVTKVLVDNGDIVKKGQLLVQLDPTTTQAELSQLRSREVSLTLDSERLHAFLNNQPADLVAWGQKVIESKYNPVKNKEKIKNLLQGQKKLLESQYLKLKDQAASLKNTIAQRVEKLKELKNQRVIWKEHMRLLNQEFEMYQKLKKNNYVSHRDYLTVLRAVNKAKGDGETLLSEIGQTEEAIHEANNKLKELYSKAREEAFKDLSKNNSELLEVRHKIEKQVDQINRKSVRAPISGTVKGVKVFAGNIVQPGGELLQIVPVNTELWVESKIKPRDIGFVKVGDKVKVKVITYDYARYGSVEGVLIKISASTFTDKEDQPYYKATIDLEQDHIGAGGYKKDLKAGMTVEANIITGEKTLLQYLLKPINRTTSKAFRER